MSAPKLGDALATARVVHDRATLEAAIERMAAEIAPEYANDARAPLYITVMHGGLPFAAIAGNANWWAPGPLKRLHARIGLREG